MEQKQVRCVNDKTGKVRYLSMSVVNNRGFMRNYGWRVEELPETTKEQEAKHEIKQVEETQAPEEVAETEFPEVPAVVVIDEVETTAITEQPSPTKAGSPAPKAVRKPRKQKTTK